MTPTTRQVMGWWDHWKLNRRGKRPKHHRRTRREQRAQWAHNLTHGKNLLIVFDEVPSRIDHVAI